MMQQKSRKAVVVIDGHEHHIGSEVSSKRCAICPLTGHTSFSSQGHTFNTYIVSGRSVTLTTVT